MLRFFEFLPEKNDPYEKKVDRTANSRVHFYLLPGLLHFKAPVNIVKDKNGMVIHFWQQTIKIIQSWFTAVVTIDKG
jgi:hypothetical protein